MGGQQVEQLPFPGPLGPVTRLDDDLDPVLAAHGRRFERLRLHDGVRR